MGKISAARLRVLTKPGVFGDGAGLYLQVRDAEHRSWIYRYRMGGKARWMGLGSLPAIGLAEAREAATTARKAALAGLDPIDARRAERAETTARAGLNTFAEVATAYIAAHRAGWRNSKHAAQWTATLEGYAYPIMGNLGVGVIDTGHVTRILTPIWEAKPETASRLRGRIEAVLDFAKAHGWRTGDNPARWKGHLANILPARGKLARVKHHAALPWTAIGAFMSELAPQEGVAALALRFTVLTAARTGETTGATWREVSMDNAVWTVPGARMKAGREHRVPLSDGAIAVLRDAARLRTGHDPAAFIFPGAKAGKPLSGMAMSMLLRRMERGGLTVHGMRSSFRDWCAEATGYPRELAEAALAHTLRDKVEAAYQRGDMMDKRRKLMGEWASFCHRPLADVGADGKVVALRGTVVDGNVDDGAVPLGRRA